jgi:hypothetical protein
MDRLINREYNSKMGFHIKERLRALPVNYQKYFEIVECIGKKLFTHV